MSNESIKPPTTSNSNLSQVLNYTGTKIWGKLDGRCIKEDKITYTHETVVNIYIM